MGETSSRSTQGWSTQGARPGAWFHAAGVPRVLVTGLFRPESRMLAEALVARGLVVHGTGAASCPGVTCHDIPPATDPGFVPALARLTAKQQIDLLLPGDPAALAVSAARDGFGPPTRVVLAGPGALAVCRDVLATAWSLARRGIRTPRFAVPSDFRTWEQARTEFGESAVLRRRDDSGPSRRLAEVSGPAWDGLDDGVIIQSLAPDPAYQALVYRPRERSTVRPAVAVLTGDVPTGDPVAPLAADAVERVHAEDVQRLALASVRAVGLTGPASVDIRRTPDGVPMVLAVPAGFGSQVRAVPDLVEALLTDQHPPRAGDRLHRSHLP